jgi:hypothetical protein
LLGFETTTRITRCLLEFLAQDSTPRAVGEWNFSAVTRIVGLYSSSCPWDVFIPSYMHTHIHVYIYYIYIIYIYIFLIYIYVTYAYEQYYSTNVIWHNYIFYTHIHLYILYR